MRYLPIAAGLLLAACAVPPSPPAVPPPSAAAAAAPAPTPSPPGPPAVIVPVVEAGSPSPGVVGVAVPPLGLALNLPAVPNPIYSFLPAPAPGRLTLSNFSFDHARVETVVTASNDCYVRSPEDIDSVFDLPLNGTRIVSAPPGRDVCWRRELEPGTGPVRITSGWSDWNRAFVAYGTAVNAKL